MKNKTIKVATVFSGIGAPEQALNRMNVKHEVVFACDNGERNIDIDVKKEMSKIKTLCGAKEKEQYVENIYNCTTKKNFVEKSYKANYKTRYFFQDVRLLDGRDFQNKIDLFVGGSPCQSFSIAGKRGGLKDTRGTLFYEYARLIKEIHPKVFVFENVYGMLTHNKGKTWEIIKNTFNELGYYCHSFVLNAKDYGIPQSRKRLFVVGFANKKYSCVFDKPKEKELDKTMQYFLEENCAVGSLRSINKKLQKINNKKGKPDEIYYLSKKLIKYCLSPGTKNFFHPDARIDLPIARALLSTMGNSHRSSVNNYVTTNGRVRALTIREALRLMGFPDDYQIVVSKAQCYKQAGNSMVVDVMMAIIDSIYQTGVFCEK